MRFHAVQVEHIGALAMNHAQQIPKSPWVPFSPTEKDRIYTNILEPGRGRCMVAAKHTHAWLDSRLADAANYQREIRCPAAGDPAGISEVVDHEEYAPGCSRW